MTNKPMMYTKNQPTDNVDAWRLGEACQKAVKEPKCGGYIDRGLILLRELELKGYGVVKLSDAAMLEASPPTDTVSTNDKAQYLNMVAELIQNQKELPHDIKNMMYGRLWDLYEVEPVKSDTVTITKADYDALVADAERWRYFRETASEEMCYALCGNSNASNEELDQAIDSAKGK